jgi:predicted 3-demethylubiquinone-9 3-methyltransferase (glyoxalase superfamily)
VQKIVPNLWFDGNAKEAVDFYVSVFPNSKIISTSKYPSSAEEGLADFQLELAGKVLTVEFELDGQHFTAINAGPEFKPNPSISFMVNFDPGANENAEEHIREIYEKLIDDGEALMPLGEHSFSKQYGWVKDRYGINWQLILTNPGGEKRPFIVPSIMFSKENTNKAEEAINFYISVFKNSKVGTLARYPEDTGPAKKGSLMFSDFQLEGQWFAAMDSGADQDFSFNEAVSLAVLCKDQTEIDELWSKLSSIPEAEQCGWCKDKYGLSWQIVPNNMEELMNKPDAFSKMMKMHKIEINEFI